MLETSTPSKSTSVAADYAHSSSSLPPLLCLPAEIRHQIWQLCVTNVHIQIDYRRPNQLPKSDPDSSCQSRIKPDVLIDLRDIGTARGTAKNNLAFTHCIYPADVMPVPRTSFAYLLKSPSEHLQENSHPHHQLPAIWRVCKQLYNESHHLLYGDTNIFSFATTDVFMSFFDRHIATLGRIPRIWFPHHNDAYLVADFLSGPRPSKSPTPGHGENFLRLTSIRKVWISTTLERVKDMLELHSNGTGSSYEMGLDVFVVKHRVNRAKAFWEDRGVSVAVKQC